MSSQQQQQQGRRLRALSDAFHKTSKYALRPLEPAEFEAFFPGLPVEFVEVAYDAYRQVRPARAGGQAGSGLLYSQPPATAPARSGAPAAGAPHGATAAVAWARHARRRKPASAARPAPPRPARRRRCTRRAWRWRPTSRTSARRTRCATSSTRWSSCARSRAWRTAARRWTAAGGALPRAHRPPSRASGTTRCPARPVLLARAVRVF